VILRENVALAPYCTMGVGGPARYFVDAADEATLTAALAWADTQGLGARILGGGSNLLVADAGVDGLVIRLGLRGIETREHAGTVTVTAAAGEPWDDLVRLTVERGWAGLECLSGIPGLVGATPIQNVGAYGQDVSETITAVRALDRKRREVVTLAGAECGFAYRDSAFKSGEPGRWVVLAVTYRLTPGGAPAVRYADVERALQEAGVTAATLADVRDTVLRVRRSKSMVLDPADPNRRSCGSFFTNPIVTAEAAARAQAAIAEAAMPRWPQPDGRIKLSAAWLIERAGFARGHREGPVGLSTRHTLAIVAHDTARASDIAAFAHRIQDVVASRFTIHLTPEPIFWGQTLTP
jgi:UDP-N-acetylmuramate dehydrogenase